MANKKFTLVVEWTRQGTVVVEAKTFGEACKRVMSNLHWYKRKANDQAHDKDITLNTSLSKLNPVEDCPPELDDLSREELIQRIKDLEGQNDNFGHC